MRRTLLILAVLLLAAGSAFAQTATPTPTATPTITMTPIPTLAPRENGKALPYEATLLDHATTAISSGAVYVGSWYNKSVQITVGDACSSYTLAIEVLNGGSLFAVPPTPSGVPASFTAADVGAGATKIYSLNVAAQFVQARLSALSGCDVSVYLHGVP